MARISLHVDHLRNRRRRPRAVSLAAAATSALAPNRATGIGSATSSFHGRRHPREMAGAEVAAFLSPRHAPPCVGVDPVSSAQRLGVSLRISLGATLGTDRRTFACAAKSGIRAPGLPWRPRRGIRLYFSIPTPTPTVESEIDRGVTLDHKRIPTAESRNKKKGSVRSPFSA